MSNQFFSEHAKYRAQERYGLDLSAHDMLEILRATEDGRAQQMKQTGTGRVFIWRYRGMIVLPVLDLSGHFIISFLPPDYFTKKSNGRGFKNKQRAATAKFAPRDGYSRAKVKRAPLEES